MPKIQLKRVSVKLSRRTIDSPSTWWLREASSGPEKSLNQNVEKKKGKSVDSRKLLLIKRLQNKETKNDKFGKRPAAIEAEEIDDFFWSIDVDLNALRRLIELLFYFSFFNDRPTTLDLRFLLWKYLAKLLLERSRSARQKTITWFAACFAESSPKGELACGPLIEVLHMHCSCSWLSRKTSTLPSAGFVRRLESRSWKVRLGQRSYSIWVWLCYIAFSFYFVKKMLQNVFQAHRRLKRILFGCITQCTELPSSSLTFPVQQILWLMKGMFARKRSQHQQQLCESAALEKLEKSSVHCWYIQTKSCLII